MGTTKTKPELDPVETNSETGVIVSPPPAKTAKTAKQIMRDRLKTEAPGIITAAIAKAVEQQDSSLLKDLMAQILEEDASVENKYQLLISNEQLNRICIARAKRISGELARVGVHFDTSPGDTQPSSAPAGNIAERLAGVLNGAQPEV